MTDLASDPFVAATVDRLFAPRVASGAVPGSIVAVFGPGGEIVHARGFGTDRLGDSDGDGEGAGGATPDLDTAYRIASCTKSFTASAVLLLRDRGAVGLDQPITDFVPEFHWADGFPDAPTLRQLLSMSGGLPTDDPWADRQESLSDDAFRDVIAAGTPRDSIPGSRYEYSNFGFALLGRAIARAAGEPYIPFVTRELLEPLGLENTGFTVEGRPGRVARGYRRASDGRMLELPFSGPGAFSPIGGLVTSARELARWAGWLASALTEEPEPGPLSAASRRELQQVHRTSPASRPGVDENGYGFGLVVEQGREFGHTVAHSGGYPGFSAHMRWNAPGGFGVVAFENLTYAGVSVPVTALMDALIAHRGTRPIAPEPWPHTVELARQADRLLDAWIAQEGGPAGAATSSAQTDADADALAAEILSPNVALDVPYAERRAVLRRLEALPATGEPALEASASRARVAWNRPAVGGAIRVEMLVTPTIPGRIQTLKVTAVEEDPEG